MNSRLITIPLALFLAGLGVIIGSHMTPEAMGVVVGVVLGVAATIPMTLLVMLFMAKRDEQRKTEQPQEPIVIIHKLIDGRTINLEGSTFYAGGRWRQIEPPKEPN